MYLLFNILLDNDKYYIQSIHAILDVTRPMDKEPGSIDRDETLFLKAFGIKSPALRILDFLMDNKAYDYSKTDIAKGAGISRTTLSTAWNKLEKPGLVIETRPDEINPAELAWLRHLGVTKVQIGAQSLDERILKLNRRGHTAAQTLEAAALLRVSKRTLQRLIRVQAVPHAMLGRAIRFRRTKLLAWLDAGGVRRSADPLPFTGRRRRPGGLR